MSSDTQKKFKLPSWTNYVLLGLEIALMIALVVVSFITMKQAEAGSGSGFIKWLIMNRFAFFMIIVLPLILLFLYNIYLLIKIMNDTTIKATQSRSTEELLELARQQAREEVMREMQKQKEEDK